MPAYVIDTSVVLKWFVERGEANVIQARALRDAYLERKCSLSAPSLLLLEVANALAVGQRQQLAEVREALLRLRDIDLRITPVGWESLERTVELAVLKGITVYDACFLTAAVESESLLITADDAFLSRLGPHPSAIALRDLRLPD